MPDWTEQLRARLAGLRLDPAREAEIVEELAQHLEQRYEELLSRGLDAAAAGEAVSRELLDPGTLAEHMRSLRLAKAPRPIPVGAPGRRLFADLWLDVRLAARMLRKQAGLTAAVVATLALGIGANGAIFALVDAVLLRELPFPNPDRLTMLWERTETTPRSRVSPLNLVDWRERSRSFDGMAGFNPNVGGMVMSGPDGAETIPRQWVTAGVFSVLGVNPVVGRTFLPANDTSQFGGIVLAEPFWRARFDSDPNVVGQTLRLDGEPFTIVGIVPQEAELLGQVSIWAMLPIQNLPDDERDWYPFNVVARLKPGISLEAAHDDLASIAASLAREYPATNEGRGVTIQTLREVVLGSDVRRTSLLFLGVVGLVLLICFANIATLLLTRTAARRGELAIRSMLGADRNRLLRQLFTESLVLSMLGGLAALAVAALLLRAAPSVIPTDLLPSGIGLDFGWRTALFCAAATLIVGTLFGFAASSQAGAFRSPSGAVPNDRTVTDRSGRARELLVVGQIATAFVLVYCAGLLSRTLLELAQVDSGYGADSVLTMLVDPLSDQYPSPESLRQFYGAVEDEVAALPGVSSVAWSSALPLGRSMAPAFFFEVSGEPASAPSERPTAEWQVVSAEYFRALDLPMLTGRAFDDRDTPDGPPVCIVNTELAGTYLPDRSAVGTSISRWRSVDPDAQELTCEIVGVAANTRTEPDETRHRPRIYSPTTRFISDDIFMIVRPERGDAETLISSVRAAIGRVDRDQLVAVRDIATLEDIGHEATSRYRFRATLVGAFAGLSLLLAMVGLFGVLAYSVQRRWREYGVRIALGAKPRDVIGLVTRGAVRLLVPGVLVGAGLAIVAGQLLGALLFGVRPLDATTFAAVLGILAATAAASVAAPALRAARLDPAGTLRSE